MKNTILIVDDEKIGRESLKTFLAKDYNIHLAANGEEALNVLKDNDDIDLILSDMRMPEMDGIELLERVEAEKKSVLFIFMTAFSTIESAVSAMRKGAYDYLTKPLDINKVEIALKNALENKRLKIENTLLKQKIRDNIDVTTLVGESEKIKKTLELVKRVSSTKATVFIHGESGTGKELVANIIHYTSQVADGPFIKVNCSALAEGVMESELFGHEKGAFTGAAYQKKGRFELADKGTLFLDEIGDLPPFIQVKLLRFLQESEFERVGGTKTLKVDVRIVSATNKNLEELVRKEKFRDDLFYRLKVVTVDVIPLRERVKDIPLIADYHLKRLTKIHNKSISGITPDAMKIILTYSWPGNIRELINCIESAVVMASHDVVDVESLPSFLFTKRELTEGGDRVKPATINTVASDDSISEVELDKCLTLFDIEKRAILDVFNKVGGNKAQTAKHLGIGLRTLYRKLEQYGMKDDKAGE